MSLRNYAQKIPVHRLAAIGLALLTGLTLVLALVATLYDAPKLGRPHSSVDFDAYYEAAKSLNAGETPYIVFTRSDLVEAGLVANAPYIYPPFFASIMRPAVAVFSLAQLKFIWFVVEMMAVVGAIWLLISLFNFSLRLGLVIFGTIGLVPVVQSMLYGQVSTLLLVLIVASLYLVCTARDNRFAQIISGGLLGVAIGIKIYPAFALLVYLLYRRFTATVSAVVTTLLTGVVGLIVGGGLEAVFYFATTVMPGLAASVDTNINNQSFKAILEQIFTAQTFIVAGVGPELQYISGPIIDAPWLVTPLHLVVSIIIMVVSLALVVQLARTDDSSLEYSFAVMSAATLVVLPTVWPHYASLVLIPAFVAVHHALRSKAPVIPWLLVCASLLITLYRYWLLLIRVVPTGLFNKTMAIGLLLMWVTVVYVAARYPRQASVKEPATLKSLLSLARA